MTNHPNRKQSKTDAQRICHKWAKRIGLGFHPDTRGTDYSPPFSAAVIREYDADMRRLFSIKGDPYAYALAALMQNTETAE